jgi:hypothetical protein
MLTSLMATIVDIAYGEQTQMSVLEDVYEVEMEADAVERPANCPEFDTCYLEPGHEVTYECVTVAGNDEGDDVDGEEMK